MEKSGISVTELARQSIYNMLNAELEQARLTTFIQLANALRIHPLDLMRVFFSHWELPTNTPPAPNP